MALENFALVARGARARIILFLAFTTSGISAIAELSTVNRDSLAGFWNAVEQSNRPITIVSFGDSMADSYRSLGAVLMNRFHAQMGEAGYSLNNYRNRLMWRMKKGARTIGPSEHWFTEHYRLPPRSELWWASAHSARGVLSDNVGVFWVAQPGGGQMTLSISTKGGPWKPVCKLNGYAAVPTGGYTNFALKLEHHRLRVQCITGTNFVIGPHLLNSRTSGVHAVFMERPEIYLGHVTRVPRAVRDPVMRALQPDLLIWHMKEDGSEATRQRLIECENWWSSTAPNCSVLYVGTPWLAADSNHNYTVEQNTLVRSFALAHDRAYVDCATPAISYSFMLTNGYMDDVTHQSYKGNSFLGAAVWDDLGFFALGKPREMQLAPAKGGYQIRFPTATAVTYTVEESGNLLSWTPVLTARGNGLMISTNVPGENARFFRLRLTP